MTDLSRFSSLSPNPLKPTLLVKHAFQSFYISLKLTLSCGLLGPDKLGSTDDKSNSITAPENSGSTYFPSYVLNNPYLCKYSLTILTLSSDRPVKLR